MKNAAGLLRWVFWTRKVREEHFLLRQVCFERRPVGFGRLAVLGLEGESCSMCSCVSLVPLRYGSRPSWVCPEVTCLRTSRSPLPSAVGWRRMSVLKKVSVFILTSLRSLCSHPHPPHCLTGMIRAYPVVFSVTLWIVGFPCKPKIKQAAQ